MKVRVMRVLTFFGVLSLAVIAHAQSLPHNGLVGTVLDPQLQDSWCWAASGEMAMGYLGVNVQQCAEANVRYGQTAGVDCCLQPASAICNKGSYVVIGNYGFTYQQLGAATALTYSQIEDQIATRNEPWILNPYCANQSACGTWGHVLVGSGYYWPTQPLFLIFVDDPWPVNTGSTYLLPYWEYQSGCWWGNGNCTAYAQSIYAEGYDLYDIVPPSPSHPIPFHHPLIPVPHLPPAEIQHIVHGDPDPLRETAMGWHVIRQLLIGDPALRLGFDKATIATARLGVPLQQYDVLLTMLRSWNKEGSANGLMLYMPTVLVPVENQAGHIRAVLRLRETNNLWRLSAFGSTWFGSAWEKAHVGGGQFVVMVEGLELAFAGKRVGHDVELSPLFSDPHYDLETGRYEPAESVLGRLVEAARSYRGNGGAVAPSERAQ